MDLSSLPDEMVTRILKYADFNTIRSARKLNRMIERIAKRADLGIRVPVECFELFQESCSMTTKFANEIPDDDNMRVICKSNQMLESCLSKVNILSTLIISDCIFDEDFLALIMKQRKRLSNLKLVQLMNVVFSLDATNVKIFLEIFGPKLQTLHLVFHSRHELNNFFDFEILTCRTWNNLEIFALPVDQLRLNDKFLLDVAPKCRKFSLRLVCAFTLNGAVALLKKCLAENRFSHQFDLGELKFEEMPMSEIEDRFRFEFPGSQFVKQKFIDGVMKVKVEITHLSMKHICKFEIMVL